METNTKSIFDALYDRLILRDVTAKIVPGAVVIVSLTITTAPLKQIAYFLDILPWAFWFLFIGLTWIIGFSVQSLGEILRIKRIYYPENEFNSKKEYFKLRSEFIGCASSTDRSTSERLTALYESSANCAISIWVSLLILGLNLILNNGSLALNSNQIASGSIVALGFILVLSFSLIRLHHVVIREHIEHMKSICDLHNETKF